MVLHLIEYRHLACTTYVLLGKFFDGIKILFRNFKTISETCVKREFTYFLGHNEKIDSGCKNWLKSDLAFWACCGHKMKGSDSVLKSADYIQCILYIVRLD